MPRSTNLSVATMGIDIGKNSFHVVGLANLDRPCARRRCPRTGRDELPTFLQAFFL